MTDPDSALSVEKGNADIWFVRSQSIVTPSRAGAPLKARGIRILDGRIKAMFTAKTLQRRLTLRRLCLPPNRFAQLAGR